MPTDDPATPILRPEPTQRDQAQPEPSAAEMPGLKGIAESAPEDLDPPAPRQGSEHEVSEEMVTMSALSVIAPAVVRDGLESDLAAASPDKVPLTGGFGPPDNDSRSPVIDGAQPPSTPADVARQSTLVTLEANPVVRMVTQAIEPFRKYSATRRAIRRGESLYDSSPEDLARSGYMGPWSFNLAETAFAAIPTTMFITVLTFFWPHKSEVPDGTPELARRAAELQPAIGTWLQPLLVPLALMLIASLAAWGSLFRIDSTPDRRRRAKYAYLYYDGAYGIVPQFCFGLGITLFAWLEEREWWPLPIALAVGALIVYAWGHLIYITCVLEPKKLFALHGYSPVPIHFWTPRRKRPPNPGPWTKYGLSVLIGGGCMVYVLAIIVGVAIVLLALLLATIQMRAA